jgi:hypothetical protein
MAINITVGKPADEATTSEETPEKQVQERVRLDARRTLDGNLMVFDHQDIDIVIVPSSNTVVTFPKDLMEDRIYATQDRFFYFMRKKGVVLPETVRGGAVYGSIEATMATPSEKGVSGPQVVLSMITEFIKEEKPYFRQYHDLEEEWVDDLTDPDDMHSTDLGEVPERERQGSLRPGYIRGPYGMTSFYRYEE